MRGNGQFEPMRTAHGLLPERACLSLTGPDCVDFLDKLITQSVRDLAIGTQAYGALLSPQGKISADFFIWRTDTGFLLDAHEARIAMLQERLARFRLRAAVEIDRRPELAIAAYGDGVPAGALVAGLDPRRAEWGGRAVVPARDAPEPCARIDLLTARIEAGLPDLAEDAGLDEIFALEGLLEELNGVSFKKGCFPGQENVSRMKRRATTRRKFCRLRFAGPAPVAGATVRAGEAELGSVRAVGMGAALAFLRLDRALAAPEPLTIDAIACHLDPPAWLHLPPAQSEDEASNT